MYIPSIAIVFGSLSQCLVARPAELRLPSGQSHGQAKRPDSCRLYTRSLNSSTACISASQHPSPHDEGSENVWDLYKAYSTLISAGYEKLGRFYRLPVDYLPYDIQVVLTTNPYTIDECALSHQGVGWGYDARYSNEEWSFTTYPIESPGQGKVPFDVLDAYRVASPDVVHRIAESWVMGRNGQIEYDSVILGNYSHRLTQAGHQLCWQVTWYDVNDNEEELWVGATDSDVYTLDAIQSDNVHNHSTETASTLNDPVWLFARLILTGYDELGRFYKLRDDYRPYEIDLELADTLDDIDYVRLRYSNPAGYVFAARYIDRRWSFEKDTIPGPPRPSFDVHAAFSVVPPDIAIQVAQGWIEGQGGTLVGHNLGFGDYHHRVPQAGHQLCWVMQFFNAGGFPRLLWVGATDSDVYFNDDPPANNNSFMNLTA